MDIHELSALDLAAAIRRRELSAAEVLAHTQRRMEGAGALVGAFAHVTPGLASAQAAAADAAVARRDGEPLPPLLGVPVPVKDLAMVAGEPFEAGSLALRGFVAPVDDGVVTLLRAAGTVMVGKTTTPEFGLPCYTEPATGAPARTPWDLARTAGGSSGGAAAAVAAGVAPAAHGSDGGGSIRIPAACCGVVGMKPSRGCVSPGPHRAEGIGLATDGVLTRTVRDSAVLLDVLARPWPGDTYRAAAPASSFLAACDAAPPPLRVGVLTEPLNTDDAPIHPEALAAVGRAARLLEGLGHHVDAAPRAMTGEDWMAFMPLWTTMAAQAPVPPEAEEVLVPLTRWLREMGRTMTGVQYAAAHARMQQLGRQIAAAWAGFDVILTPTLAQPPLPPAELQLPDPAADFEAQKRFTPWTSVWNMAGAPAISLPLHRAVVEGTELPFGVMLGGVHPGQEETLFALAAQLEAADPWPRVREPAR